MKSGISLPEQTSQESNHIEHIQSCHLSSGATLSSFQTYDRVIYTAILASYSTKVVHCPLFLKIDQFLKAYSPKSYKSDKLYNFSITWTIP